MFSFIEYITGLGFKSNDAYEFFKYEDGASICVDENSVSYSSGDGERLEVCSITSKEEADWFLYFTGFAKKPQNQIDK